MDDCLPLATTDNPWQVSFGFIFDLLGSSGCQPFSQQQQQNPTSYCPSCNDGPTYNAPSQLNAPNQYYAQIPQQSPIPPFAVAPPVNGPLPQQDALPSGLNSNDLNVAEVKGEENKLVFAVDTTTSPLPPANPFVGVVEQEVDVRCSTPQEFGSVNSLLNCLQVEHTPFAGQAGNLLFVPQEQIFFGRATFPSPVLPAIVPSLIELFHRTPPLNNISNQLPAGYFLIAHEPVGNDPRKSAILRLDIACQMGDGLLSFDYWSSYENVLLKVCTRLDRERRCTSQIVYGIESPRVEVQVVHPQPSYRSAFAVEIIVSGFFQPAWSTASGSCCPERIDQARGISKIKWSGEKTATLLAKKAAKALSIYNLQAGSEVGRMQFSPQERAKCVEYVNRNAKAPAVNSIKECYANFREGDLRRKEKTGNKWVWTVISQDKVDRAIEAYRHRLEYCQEPRVYHQASLARLYPLVPRSTTYWHLKQQANNFKQLQPLAQYEQSSVTRNNFTPNKLGIRRLNACELLGCSFDHENWCHYTQPSLVDNGLARYGKWQLARPDVRPEISRRILQASKGFAFVGGLDNHLELEGQLIYILQSASFKLDHPVKLLFDLYQRSNSISLQVCLNHLDNCVYESPAIIRPNTFWRRNQMVEVPVSTHRVLFVATQWKHNKRLAVDNIRLANCTL
uniref:Uncharacterized protein n=1 Tax=Ditylenchus dipsaci TaxID=166011 RepID=A0A915EDB9_9BILA